MNLLSVLPLAVVMVAGPQLVGAIFLASSRTAKRSSLAYLTGAALAVAVSLTVWYVVFRAVRHTGDGGGGDRTRHLIDGVVLVVLLVLMVLIYLRRRHSQPPKWMGRLEEAPPGFAFGLGLLLFAAMPSDQATMLSVAASLAGHDKPWWHLLPFAVLTLVLLALPLLTLLVLGHRALVVLPRIRDWANAHSWLVSEAVIVIFVALVVSDLFR